MQHHSKPVTDVPKWSALLVEAVNKPGMIMEAYSAFHNYSKMGWEQRGNNRYYYRKERDGSRVKSVYVGRGEIAHLISQFQSSSTAVERIALANRLPESTKAEATLDLATELIQLVTNAALLTAGFHTHHRQWRRKRNARP